MRLGVAFCNSRTWDKSLKCCRIVETESVIDSEKAISEETVDVC